MGAQSKRARKVRESAEFDAQRLAIAVNPPKTNAGAIAWSLADIFAARDQQMGGRFYRPARLAESMRTDDALAVAFENRLAPQRCIPVCIKPAKGARAAAISNEAEALFGQNGVGLRPETLADIHGCLVNHGVAFGVIVATPREDGSRVDIEMHAWPIEYVRWDSFKQCFVTRIDEGLEEDIIHGGGRWVVFSEHEREPWKYGALLPASSVWARHAFASRDWAKGSVSHGNAKVIGELPEGIALQKEDGSLTDEAAAFLEVLKAIGSADAPVGIIPAGAKVQYLTNTSTAWQVWQELISNAEKAAARIYLGTDGTLGAQGGAPGIDIQALFGVALTRVQGDLACIERGILTGVIEPWCAMNFGDSTLAPQRVYEVPDADEDARRASFATRNQALFADLKAAREAGVAVSITYIEKLAKEHGVPSPIETDDEGNVVTGPATTPAPSAVPLRVAR